MHNRHWVQGALNRQDHRHTRGQDTNKRHGHEATHMGIPRLVTARALIFGPHFYKIHFLGILSESLSSLGTGLVFLSRTKLTDARFKIFLHRLHAKVATIANRAKEGQKVRSYAWKLWRKILHGASVSLVRLWSIRPAPEDEILSDKITKKWILWKWGQNISALTRRAYTRKEGNVSLKVSKAFATWDQLTNPSVVGILCQHHCQLHVLYPYNTLVK